MNGSDDALETMDDVLKALLGGKISDLDAQIEDTIAVAP